MELGNDLGLYGTVEPHGGPGLRSPGLRGGPGPDEDADLDGGPGPDEDAGLRGGPSPDGGVDLDEGVGLDKGRRESHRRITAGQAGRVTMVATVPPVGQRGHPNITAPTASRRTPASRPVM
ncbi:hypothetical protein GCM10010517_26460 [Streptosporangium fragile]|uniref:Uncharacterized protein n=1 Tax=Streptosporangium fragile TaxID=46186 RepID=A0ABP6IBW4_9ACTN